MKKIIISMLMMLVTVVTVSAMPYQQAREQALFLTDKMAYELNLNDEQYEAAYEINLDYLMSVNTVDDVYAASWRQRNLDLQYILLDWQYNTFCAASYFFRPLYWSTGNWHFAVYAHYPRHDFFYFSRPTCYVSYRGAHSWRNNGGSWYMHRVDHFRRPAAIHVGLRDNYRPEPGRRPNPNSGRPTFNNRYNNTNRPGYRDDYNDRRPNNRDNNDNRPGYNNNNNRPGYNNNNRPGYNNNNRPDYRGNNNWQNRDERRTYNRESSTRRTVTNGNGGYRPSPNTAPPSRGTATRSGGSTFRGGSNQQPATGMRR